MNKRSLISGISLLVSFIVWTLLVSFVDVAPIGPRGSSVGFSTLNGAVHSVFGVHMSLYVITDWLGLVPIFVCLCFAVLGLVQWIKRKSIFKVDKSIIVLGIFYIAVIIAYVIFEFVVINHRPVLIEGYLEASYPSSTTMLVMTVMPTTAMQLGTRISKVKINRIVAIIIWTFLAFMVIGRLVSGVHWITDIIGGALLSSALVMLYHSAVYYNK